MEARTDTTLRSVVFLSMLMLSLAASPVPPPDFAFEDSKFKLKLDPEALKCAKKCALDCSVSLFSPVAYSGCFGLCMAACKLHKLPGGDGPPTADMETEAAGQPANSDPTFACTRNCANSMSKVMTTNAKVTASKDTAAAPSAKPSIPDLQRYAEGYVDSCALGCSMNNKLY